MKFIFEFPLNCEILKLKSYRKIFFSNFYVQPISRVVNFQTYIRYIWKIKQKYDLHYFSKCEYKNVHVLMWEGIVRFVDVGGITITVLIFFHTTCTNYILTIMNLQKKNRTFVKTIPKNKQDYVSSKLI